MYTKTIAMLLVLLLAKLTFGLPFAAQEETPNPDDNLQAALDAANAFEGETPIGRRFIPTAFVTPLRTVCRWCLFPLGAS